MPKAFSETRRAKAMKLRKQIETGPSFNEPTRIGQKWDDPEGGFSAQYKRWAESWIIPQLIELVPELRKAEAMRKLQQLHPNG